MSAMPNAGADQSQALEALAAQAQRNLDDVRQLYECERQALAAEARVSSFLSIFALRNVRARLLENKDEPALH
ncbi:hypothetical protein HNP55_004409 [Paucibacter oligotrophus]|uniref:Uncharacterized protein n=1 Tax=Roseateles oligotrophus TaxID=1769250 RepID=A0A840LFR7_9BURK|nr:DUF3562 domain-containing protein [Roseateles oligotrophus]MBB4845855.1 hypothetical protein [Roseateles oligotrophus]